MVKVQMNLANADRAARQKNGKLTIHRNGGVTFYGTPLSCMPAKHGHGDGCNVWKDPKDVVDEWDRVQTMRRLYPAGLVAGGNNSNPTFVPCFVENNERRWEEKKDLERRGSKLGLRKFNLPKEY